ncbi:MAG TPA: TerC/Alx family metal homeostasis membrane protein, partial [Myxococcaceae bacterium]|nr:TerC/Alx family metal homeostasis membrane protein [Myxococcaceae bacterium]
VWVLFNAGELAVLSIDLGVARVRGHRAQTAAEAGRWVLLWVALSLAFGAGLWAVRGHERGLEFFTAYVIEYALSVDNLFVFLLVFQYFRVQAGEQHLLLFWGVLGAFLLRGSMILGGAALVQEFEWLLYLFGAFLLWTAFKLVRGGEDAPQADPAHNPVMRVARRVLPVAESAPPDRFLVRSGGRLQFTPLFLVLLVVETTDLMFALDSIPAVLGVSRDPFVLYSSNVTAVLGLRSLFFLLRSLLSRLHYLKPALAVVLGFVGLKMLVEPWLTVPVWLSLSVIGGVLLVAFVASWWRARRLPAPLD